MCGATVCIDVRSIRLVVDHISLSSKCIINTFRNGKCTSVRTVKSDTHILERACGQRDQMSDIPVSSRRIVNRSSNRFLLCKRNFSCFPIDISFNLIFDFCLQFVSFSINYFDTVIIEWIMAGGNHNTAVKIFGSRHIRNAGGCRYMQKIRICSGSSKPCCQCIFKHIAAPSGILADHDSRLVLLPVIPSQISSNFECMLYCQIHICFPTEAICSKIFTHIIISFGLSLAD